MATSCNSSSMLPPGDYRGAPHYEVISAGTTQASALTTRSSNYALPTDNPGTIRDDTGAITFSLTKFLSGTGKELYDRLKGYSADPAQDLELKAAIENGLSAVAVYRQKYGITNSGTENAADIAAVNSGQWYLKNVATNPASPINIGKAGLGSVTGIINDIKVSTAAVQAGGAQNNQFTTVYTGNDPFSDMAGAPMDEMPITEGTEQNTLSKITGAISENSLIVAGAIIVLFIVLAMGTGIGGKSHGV